MLPRADDIRQINVSRKRRSKKKKKEEREEGEKQRSISLPRLRFGGL
jgi:hypothetical protein